MKAKLYLLATLGGFSLLLGACKPQDGAQESSTQVAAPASAEDTQAKIALIEAIYKEAREKEAGFEMLSAYMTEDFKAARAVAENADEAHENCMLYHDPLWHSQDPQTDVAISFDMMDNGWVKASFSQWDSPVEVYFDVACTAGQCLVSDLKNSGDDLSLKVHSASCKNEQV